jgi:acyl-CoA thioesterase
MSVRDPAGGDLGASLGQQRVIRFDPGHAAIEYLVSPMMCHSGGIAQGGFVCGWIDAAMAHAVMAERGDIVPMSLELKVSFFAPAQPGPVIAEGWVERRGGSTWFVEGRLLDMAGTVLAKGSSTIRLLPISKVSAVVAKGQGAAPHSPA